MEYKIISAPSGEGLVFVVNSAIAEGWAPCGGPFFTHGFLVGVFYQAMIRMKRPEPQHVQPVTVEAVPASHNRR